MCHYLLSVKHKGKGRYLRKKSENMLGKKPRRQRSNSKAMQWTQRRLYREAALTKKLYMMNCCEEGTYHRETLWSMNKQEMTGWQASEDCGNVWLTTVISIPISWSLWEMIFPLSTVIHSFSKPEGLRLNPPVAENQGMAQVAPYCWQFSDFTCELLQNTWVNIKYFWHFTVSFIPSC